MMNKAIVPPAVLAASMICAALAHADGTQESAERRQVYEQVVPGCASGTQPAFQRIVWDAMNGNYGTGRIVDGKPGLGGPFTIAWDNTNGPGMPGSRKVPAQPQGYWDVVLEFC
jgi:hypothetical protein